MLSPRACMRELAAVADDVVQNLYDAASVSQHWGQAARQVVDQLHLGLGLWVNRQDAGKGEGRTAAQQVARQVVNQLHLGLSLWVARQKDARERGVGGRGDIA